MISKILSVRLLLFVLQKPVIGEPNENNSSSLSNQGTDLNYTLTTAALSSTISVFTPISTQTGIFPSGAFSSNTSLSSVPSFSVSSSSISSSIFSSNVSSSSVLSSSVFSSNVSLSGTSQSSASSSYIGPARSSTVITTTNSNGPTTFTETSIPTSTTYYDTAYTGTTTGAEPLVTSTSIHNSGITSFSAFPSGSTVSWSTTSVTANTHDSSGNPVLGPWPLCWFCPLGSLGITLFGFSVPGIYPPGGSIPGLSDPFPALTIDPNGNPSYESSPSASLTPTGSASQSSSTTSCSTITATNCAVSCITYSLSATQSCFTTCSTVTSCSASATTFSTTTTVGCTQSPSSIPFTEYTPTEISCTLTASAASSGQGSIVSTAQNTTTASAATSRQTSITPIVQSSPTASIASTAQNITTASAATSGQISTTPIAQSSPIASISANNSTGSFFNAATPRPSPSIFASVNTLRSAQTPTTFITRVASLWYRQIDGTCDNFDNDDDPSRALCAARGSSSPSKRGFAVRDEHFSENSSSQLIRRQLEDVSDCDVVTYLTRLASDPSTVTVNEVEGDGEDEADLSTTKQMAFEQTPFAFGLGESAVLNGCTVLTIISNSGVYIGHFWETLGWLASTSFERNVLNLISGADDQFETSGPAIDTQNLFGPGTNPVAYIMTSKKDVSRKGEVGVYTPDPQGRFQYPTRVNLLTATIRKLIPGVVFKTIAYDCVGDLDEESPEGAKQTAFFEYDPQGTASDPGNTWRLWYDGALYDGAAQSQDN